MATASGCSRSRVETDTFCAACGYNLHGQEVWTDDRLGLLVCRCPECGKHHPAGLGTSASFVWLKRLGTLTLLVWIAIAIGVAGLLTFALGGLQIGYVGSLTYYQLVTPDGRAIEFAPIGKNGNYGYIDRKTRQPIGNVANMTNRLTLRPEDAYTAQNRRDISGWEIRAILILISFAVGLLFGWLLATALWHWPRRGYLLGCVLPLLACAVVSLIFVNADDYEPIRRWAIERAAMVMVVQCVGVMIGTRLGRPLSRTIARLVVPPKPRMLLAFLWHADGKTMPVVRD